LAATTSAVELQKQGGLRFSWVLYLYDLLKLPQEQRRPHPLGSGPTGTPYVTLRYTCVVNPSQSIVSTPLHSTHEAEGAIARVEEGFRGRHTDELEQVDPLRTQHMLHPGVHELPGAVRRDCWISDIQPQEGDRRERKNSR